MRKIVSNFFVSLDGVVESPDQWHFPYFDEAMGEIVGAGLATTDAMLMGGTLYREWAAYWPTSTDEGIADVMNNQTKYVVSRTLDSADWNNTTLIRDDVVDRIREVKSAPGQDIAMSGSATLMRFLLGEGLIDELALLVHPIVVGTGAKLFPDGTPTCALELVQSRTLPTGVLHLVYRPKAGDSAQ